MVRYFGTTLQDGGTLRFYCGISEKPLFRSPILRFNAPTSTSTDLKVAQMLTKQGNDGIIIEIKDTKMCDGKYINCEAFSDFSYEKEHIFMNGDALMMISNIIEIDNNESPSNRKYLNALNIITYTFSISKEENMYNNCKLNTKSISLCSEILWLQLGANTEANSIPLYIQNVAKTYFYSVTEVKINWENVKKLPFLIELLCSNSEQIPDLLITTIIKLFPNAKYVEYCNPSATNDDISAMISYITLTRIEHNLKFVLIYANKKSSFIRELHAKQYNGLWISYCDESEICLVNLVCTENEITPIIDDQKMNDQEDEKKIETDITHQHNPITYPIISPCM